MTNLKTTLQKLHTNFNTLREREAKYGGNAPLDLLNQIVDHEKAIALTEQALRGELTEAEWREALKPLLVFVPGAQIYEALPPPLSPAEARNRHHLSILLNKIKTFWIEGVLEKSVHTTVSLDLGKEVDPRAVQHPWERVLELPDQSRLSLPPNKKIIDIFDQMNRAILILGEPGSGKTITLLELARDLIRRFESNEEFTEPIPVVFTLSSWTTGQRLIDWLVAELSVKYQIPKRIGRRWLEKNRLAPLLDGLDEVKPASRAACVEAINQFGKEFGLAGLAVCTRAKEYRDLSVRLKLNGAIRLQPLTLGQIDNYLITAGAKLEHLHLTLQKDRQLCTLAQSPLMLSIMSLAYQDSRYLDSKESAFSQDFDRTFDTIETRRRVLFDTYIEQMLNRKGKSNSYTDQQTMNWLTWLAQ